MELELPDFDLPTALDSALTLVRERAGRRSITLQMNVDERLGEVRADERKVRQVVLNLLSNAIKFRPEGGRIEVAAVPKDGSVEVSVSDTGVGIAPEDQEAIFEEFRQETRRRRHRRGRRDSGGGPNGQLADIATRRASITEELTKSTARERRLLDALVDGDGTADLIRSRLREELTRRDALTAELSRLDAVPTLDSDAIVRDVTARTADLRGLLTRNVTQARQVIRLLLDSRLVCTPFDDGEGHGYTFEAMGTYRRLGVPLVNVGGGPNGRRRLLEAVARQRIKA